MKLSLKSSLWMLGGAVIVMFAASFVMDTWRNSRTLKNLSQENLKLLEEREWKSAENVFITTENAVKGSLERGEMEKFIRLLEAQKRIKGLLEFSLFSREGKVTHSSESSFVGRDISSTLRSRLLEKCTPIRNLTERAFEFYEPLPIEGDCRRCHINWPEKGCGGVLYFKFSADSLNQAKMNWADSMQSIKKGQILSGTVTTIGITLVFILITSLLIWKKVIKPLTGLISNLIRTSDNVRLEAHQLTMASQNVSDGVSRQAASVEETSSSLVEISGMTEKNSATIQKVKDLADMTRMAGEAGAKDVQQMIVAMDNISASSHDIAKIIKTIDEIAFQTNLLALNAAVEAARAGEAGLGFAVVADEVRNLSQRCAHAAKETSEKIADAINRSERGAQISSKVAHSLNDIINKALEVDNLAAEVALASQEQAQGIKEVTRAVTEIDHVTQTNAASAEESASAAEQLKVQADSLKDAVLELEELVRGQDASIVSSSPTNTVSTVPQAPVEPAKQRQFKMPTEPKPLGAKIQKKYQIKTPSLEVK